MKEKKIVALTGASGNMGIEALASLMQSEYVDSVKALYLDSKKDRSIAKRHKKLYGKKLTALFGDIAEKSICDSVVSGVDYVFNLAAVIPPASDRFPELADRCNRIGAINIVDSIGAITENQPKLIHISTVALYGNRNYIHPWGRVGDPLLPSVYDCYAASKLIGERYVLESNLKSWVVLRQTAMLHNNMLTDNMKDGLMFHTCYNVPLEWVTARDSGRLIKKIVERDSKGEVNGFWKKCYNIGGGAENRCTGYDTFDKGFRLIGGNTEAFMKPTWNSIRNFHGLWFADGNQLDDIFHYQSESINDYWMEILSRHKYYALAKLLPPRIISKLAIQRLLGDANAPRKWIESGDAGKIKAYFGSKDNLSCIPDNWNSYPILAKGRLADADIDYAALKDIKNAKSRLLSHGYDENKPDSEIDLDDIKSAAEFRGGKCLSDKIIKGDLYTKLTWQCCDGHIFVATPYTVLKCGHWCPKCCQPEPWDYDRLSKSMPFYAQVWYDTHAKEENNRYYFDSSHKAKFEKYA